MRDFRKILVANRGEIALRVMRSARLLGYRTVAVFSDADAGALHVRAAHQAVRLGPAPAGESYLNSGRIVEAARRTGAGAVHPGYGFLSENAEFAAACAEAGLAFIGPPPEPIRLMGDKRAARSRMEAAGVPVVPGYHGEAQSPKRMRSEAERIGYPVMIKAAAGGGGRGMRRVEEAAGLDAALVSARSEAESAFGNGELLLEKSLDGARHVEIQVLADGHGNVVHLGERDCSVQRRHQKVIEETPSPAVSADLRERMGDAAVQASREIGYVGAGTVEFMLDASGAFYFLEMNTRLQVEHPVTELVTGLDLVAWQIRIAAGQPLDFGQQQIGARGHAIEARLYAEEPARDFLPQTGRVQAWRVAEGENVRTDHGLAEGQEIGAHYDPLLAKVVAWGESREEARRRLQAALEDTVLLGVAHNKGYLARVLEHPVFAAGQAATDFAAAHHEQLLGGGCSARLLLACAALACYGAAHPPRESGMTPPPLPLRLERAQQESGVTVTPGAGGSYLVAGEGWSLSLRVLEAAGWRWRVEHDGVISTVHLSAQGGEVYVDGGGDAARYHEIATGQEAEATGAMDGRVTAPTTGRVVAIRARSGDRVRRGQCLLTLEAMKLEHEINAPAAGTVSAIAVSEGQQVAAGTLLLEFSTEEAPPDQSAEGGAT